MKRFNPALVGSSLLILTACSFGTGTVTDPGTGASSEDPIQETENVLYRGTLREAGISIFMEGSHRLELDDGRFILLESSEVSLDKYIDQNVEVYGAIRPTTEEGGMIMRVESIASLEQASSSEESSSSSSSESSSSEASSEESSSSLPSVAASSRQSSRASSAAPVVSSAAAVSSAAISSAASVASATSSVAWEGSSELSAKAAVMAKDNMAEGNWTQKYCSTHIGFCVDVHKNWWFKSFGTTSSHLWHVEVGPQEMNNLGEGPLSINLVSGSIDTAGKTDGQVTPEGDTIVGYRSWDDKRHFEIRAPKNLEQAVRIMTGKLVKSAG